MQGVCARPQEPAGEPGGSSCRRVAVPAAEQDRPPEGTLSGAGGAGELPAGGGGEVSARRSRSEGRGAGWGRRRREPGLEGGRGGPHTLPAARPRPAPRDAVAAGCARWVAPETELSSLCLTPLFPPLSWSLSVGGGQTLGALPPAVQPPATTGVLRVLLLHAGDRALPAPRRRRLLGLLRFPHSAQPLGGEQPRAGAPPAPRAPRRRQPQTRALGAPHLAVPAAAGVGPLHPQDLGRAPPLLEGAGGGGGEQTETVVPSQDAIITLTRPVPPTVQYRPLALAHGTVTPPRAPPQGQQVAQEGAALSAQFQGPGRGTWLEPQ